MIKIDVISGFLGAGKTTLIKKLFESSFENEKVVIIENEFGEIGIDSSFLKESGVQIKEINAGCICCSLVGDFATSIKELVDTYHPDRIIIEPSGVGKLSDIVEAIKNVKLEELKLNILATIVDGPKAKIYLKNFGEFFLNQIESADTIVISKLDKMNNDKIDAVVDIIKEHNKDANVITTSIQEFNSKQLLAILEEKQNLSKRLLNDTLRDSHHDHHHHDEHCCCEEHHHEHHHHNEHCCCEEHHHEHHHHDEHCCCEEHHHEHHHHDDHCCCGHHEHHHADEVFTSWGKETAKTISYDELHAFLEKLSSDTITGFVVRAKGILKASDKNTWYYFDYVSGDYEIREGNPDYTGRIVVIGAHINEKEIETLFSER